MGPHAEEVETGHRNITSFPRAKRTLGASAPPSLYRLTGSKYAVGAPVMNPFWVCSAKEGMGHVNSEGPIKKAPWPLRKKGKEKMQEANMR